MPELMTAKIDLSTSEMVVDGITLRTVNFSGCNINAPFEAACVEVSPGCATPVDQHDVQECWIVMQGSGILEYAGEKLRVHKQDILYFQPQQQHQIMNDTDETLVIYSLYW